MLEYSTQDVVELLEACPNLNAAVKGYLKHDAGGDSRAIRFGKALRKASQSPRGVGEFVEKYHSDYTANLLAIVRQGYDQLINDLAERVISEYAEQFNETYEKDGDTINIQNQAEFASITREVLKLLSDTIHSAGVPDNGFLRNVIIDWLYDPEVVPEVLPFFAEG